MGDDGKDRDSPNGIPMVSDPPPKLDDEYVRAKLTAITQTQSKHAKIEAERAGASRLTARLVAVFGSLITAAAVASFVWVWDANVTNHAQDARIERIDERGREHDPPPPGHTELEREAVATARRVDANERSNKAINDRLDRMDREQESRHREVLEELRRLRATRRTWGTP